MSEEQDKAIEEPHPLHTLLWRIATAFEHQNSINLAWIEQQKQWHDEAEKLNAERYRENAERESRFLAIREEDSARDQAARERQLEIVEEAACIANAHNQVV